MSGGPSRATVSSTSRARSSGRDRSAAIATAVPPAPLISATVWSMVPGKAAGVSAVVRAATATAAPAAPNRRAISAPIPRLAPVTKATFPSRTPIKDIFTERAVVHAAGFSNSSSIICCWRPAVTRSGQTSG